MASLDANNIGFGTVEDEEELSVEEKATVAKAKEVDFIQGLLDAADYGNDELKKLDITREYLDENGDKKERHLFSFTIRPLSEDEINKARTKHTKYVRDRQLKVKMPEETDNARYHAQLIYDATIDEDKMKLWGNKDVWAKLNEKPHCIVSTPIDVIMCTLKAGEINQIIDVILDLSGFNSDLEEVTKN